MNMSFPMLLSVETDEKHVSFLKLYTHFLNLFFVCHLLWEFKSVHSWQVAQIANINAARLFYPLCILQSVIPIVIEL